MLILLANNGGPPHEENGLDAAVFGGAHYPETLMSLV